ncbi:MAG: pyridoxamine 5'-phosphate oxidase family protein [Eubacteriales bacterium]|nr:pyridoxamine 5'-phosphate oxidase family protein [Eubacteriales bacterium]
MTEFRKMRRFKQEMSPERTIDVLKRATSGVLAVLGDEDYPYAVPLSFVYENEKIYFHCAKSGHKLDAMRKHDKVSFCVIDQDNIVGHEFTTYFRSVIAFGRVRELEHFGEEFLHAHKVLSQKYWPEAPENKIEEGLKKDGMPMLVFVIDVEHITGKEAKELVKA